MAPTRPTSVRAVAAHHRYAPHAAIHAPSAKLMSGESNIVEMLLQPPALLQHATQRPVQVEILRYEWHRARSIRAGSTAGAHTGTATEQRQFSYR